MAREQTQNLGIATREIGCGGAEALPGIIGVIIS